MDRFLCEGIGCRNEFVVLSSVVGVLGALVMASLSHQAPTDIVE